MIRSTVTPVTRVELADGLILQEVDPSNDDILRQIGSLRVRSWATIIPEASVMDVWLDEHDANARHWIITLNQDLVAAARMTVHGRVEDCPDYQDFPQPESLTFPAPIAAFNRLVVAPSARGHGLATVLDRVRIEAARAMNCRAAIVVTPSGPRRVEQLESVGFEIVGRSSGDTRGPFAFQPTTEDVVMLCRL